MNIPIEKLSASGRSRKSEWVSSCSYFRADEGHGWRFSWALQYFRNVKAHLLPGGVDDSNLIEADNFQKIAAGPRRRRSGAAGVMR